MDSGISICILQFAQRKRERERGGGERERERRREGKRKKERERERERQTDRQTAFVQILMCRLLECPFCIFVTFVSLIEWILFVFANLVFTLPGLLEQIPLNTNVQYP